MEDNGFSNSEEIHFLSLKIEIVMSYYLEIIESI